ncbi:PhoH family protein [soil metagenome]
MLHEAATPADLSLYTEEQSFSGGETGGLRAGGRRKRKVNGRNGHSTAALVKNFVLDTNVLLHDPACLQRFEDNNVCIPVEVLGELDRFKNEPSERGANAREVHRTLSRVFSKPGINVMEGVPTDGGGLIRLIVFDLQEALQIKAVQRFQRVFHDMEKPDHRILASALWFAHQTETPVILVSKDINMQLKARAVDVPCEDYLHDKVEAREVSHMELARVDVTPHELQRFASSGSLDLEPKRTHSLAVNEYVLLSAGEKNTMPARFSAAGALTRLHVPESLRVMQGRTIKPMNLGQACLLDALMNPEISLVTCFGQAGTGKTLLACAAGLSQVMGRGYAGITVSRPIVAMGQGIGFLPGSLQEKMRPWLQPVYDALDLLTRPVASGPDFNKKKASRHGNRQESNGGSGNATTLSAPYEPMIQEGIIEIEALCYIRGRSIPDRFFILDEAQQLTPLEAKTVVTRMSRGSKLVLIGDPAQIDNPYVDSRSNGLVYTRQRMRGQPFAAHIPLSKGERSPLAEAGAKLL